MNIQPKDFYPWWFKKRHRARTDLLFLCNEVLEYKDVCADVHGPIIEKLQKFKGGTEYVHPHTQVWTGYEPDGLCWDLEGPRESLFLDPRGHLKTTVITIAHSIQWSINYPDIRILISMATGDQVIKVMGEILNHYRFNAKFRALFPEFCPPAKNAKDFGNMEWFTVPCRKRKWLKEPSFASASLGKVTASGHYEVIKNSDVVVEENVKTANQINDVKRHFTTLYPLLERGGDPPRRGWMDVEGTRYDFPDLYGWIIEGEEKRREAGESPRWSISIRKNRVPDNAKGDILWKQRFSHEDFDQMKADDPYLYAANQQNEPIPEGSGLASRDDIKFISRKVMKSIAMHWHMTVDPAGMEAGSNGDDFVFNIHGFDRDGRLRIVEILAGRFDEREVIDLLFEFCKTFPQIQDIKIEREAHWRTLKPFLMREQEKRVQTGWKYLPPIIDIRRDNKTSKKERIFGLRPWFKARLITLADEITSRNETIQEILRFSKTSTYKDDILDTIADAMQNRDGGVIYDVMPTPANEQIRRGLAPHRGMEQFMGFDPISHMDRWAGDEMAYANCDPRTGL